ncbi:binding-protein-dependent transport system inner membrane protein [Pseudomonas aeruginosa]|nr:binding-protein-dependent transport system inner membrane protein [Pseudomonas aeruginosa]
MLLPLSVLLLSWLEIDREIWSHLWDTQLPRLLGNTLTLVLGVGIGVTLLGVSLAWLTSLCEFPGRRWLDWALMLPFAIPAYVLAFVFVGLLDFAGPVQSLLREWFGSGLRLPRVRSTGGVILVLVLVFYPYVYLLARSAFIAQGKGLMEAARVLGLSPWQAFLRVALPMARPAIGAGLALAVMETLADFGAVSVFNFDTFTTAIYKTWYGFYSLSSAAQLASLCCSGYAWCCSASATREAGQGRQRASARRAAVPPARRQGAGGERLVRAGVPLRLRDSRGATGCLVLAPGPFRPRRALLGPDRPYPDAGRHRRHWRRSPWPCCWPSPCACARPALSAARWAWATSVMRCQARSWRFRSCWPSVGWTITG